MESYNSAYGTALLAEELTSCLLASEQLTPSLSSQTTLQLDLATVQYPRCARSVIRCGNCRLCATFIPLEHCAGVSDYVERTNRDGSAGPIKAAGRAADKEQNSSMRKSL